MNKEELQKFERVLHRSCKRHLANGGTLICGRFWDGGDCNACPIRATVTPIPSQSLWVKLWYLILSLFGKTTLQIPLSSSTLEQPYNTVLGKVMGFDILHSELGAFTRGFDSTAIAYCEPEDPEHQAIFRLGRKFADIYHPTRIL